MMFLFVEYGNFLVLNPFNLHLGFSWLHNGRGKFSTCVSLQLKHDGVNVV